ncbi:MAG: hypothetical protein LAT68_07900 [Cyclobacteriaceae bacterium]|nr:hypothetical protein [Cyclobacteriaceae bacterium]MCH8516236.1 hypothetical protein [Cyclobacteriaceae bacterium]
MIVRKAYQTLDNRDIHEIESKGPFLCKRMNAWLGEGYYFWDSFIENAHWWGESGARYNNGYVICESSYDLDDEKCFNLVDNPSHLDQFNGIKKILVERGLYKVEETTVARVIEFIKKIGVFNFEAIRVFGINSVGQRSSFSNRTIFVYKGGKNALQYLDSTPAIQINFLSKKGLNRRGFKIVYPLEYTEGYLV